jgi:hypothetical protein
MQKTKYLFVLLFLISISYTLKGQELVSSSGNFHHDTNFQMSWSLGEIMIETFSGTNSILTQGFHQSRLSVSSVFVQENSQINVHLYPNPAKDFVVINTDDHSGLTYFLYSLDGRAIKTDRIVSHETTLDFQDLSPGVYIIRISQGNFLLGNYKVIKN